MNSAIFANDNFALKTLTFQNRRRRGKGPGAATNPDKMEKNASQSIGASKAKRTATANQVFYHRSHLNFKSDGLLEGLIIKTNRKISVVD